MKKTVKILLMLVVSILMVASLTGCGFIKPYNKPEYVTIQPNETAFVIPLQGKTSEQGKFQSEDYLKAHEVATKRIQISHIWVKTGRLHGSGKWIDAVRVITVDRTPVSREWTNDVNKSSSGKSQGIEAESKDSIKFSVGISATAQIDADKASKFLYNFASSKTLAQVMDNQIRNKVETEIIQVMSNYNMDDIRASKDKIIQDVRDRVIGYFSQKGITITNLGYKGDFKYNDPKVQQALTDVFNAQREQQAQAIKNATKVQQAQADAKAVEIQAQTIQSQITLKELENQKAWIEKWDGKLPSTVAGSQSNAILQVPGTK